jgi:hypothetical protein
MTWTTTVTLTNNRAFTFSAVIGGALLFFLYLTLFSTTLLPEFRGYMQMMRVVTSALLAGGLVFSLWAFAASLARGLVKTRGLILAAAVWAPLAAWLLAAIWGYWPVMKSTLGSWPEALALGAAALVVFPLTPLAAAPLALSKGRHLS